MELFVLIAVFVGFEFMICCVLALFVVFVMAGVIWCCC